MLTETETNKKARHKMADAGDALSSSNRIPEEGCVLLSFLEGLPHRVPVEKTSTTDTNNILCQQVLESSGPLLPHQKRRPRRRLLSFSTKLFLLLLCFFLGTWVVKASAATDQDQETKPGKKVGIVTLITTKAYIPGALVLAESLDQVHAKGDRILLWVGPDEDPRSDLTPDDITRLSHSWNKVIQLTRAAGTYTECQISDLHKQAIAENPKLTGLDRYWGTCSKFAIWTLTDYDIVVYMDADSMALENFDFVFDFLDQDDDNNNSNANILKKDYSFAAHAVPECWTSTPPECDNFYTAFMVIKPMPNIQNYLHSLASQQYLAEGEITLLNQVIQHWKLLPRFTLVAQTETVRPTNPQTGRIDWDTHQAKVYDFAGSPETKPWMSHKLSKEHHNPHWHAYFGPMQPGTEAHARYMIPQMLWNEHYDRILAREETTDKETGAKASHPEEL